MNRKKSAYLCLFILMIALSNLCHPGLAQEPEDLPLIEDGPYFVGRQSLTFVDSNREDWTITAEIWYPAIMPEDLSLAQLNLFTAHGMKDAEPDDSAAPYPLIIYSHGWTQGFLQSESVLKLLASQGFVAVSPQHHDSKPAKHEYVDRPLDIITVLDGLAAISDSELRGLIDTSNVGLMGFSQGAEASLQMIGLLTDVTHYESWCAEHTIDTYDCGFVPLDETVRYRAELGLEDMADERWQPFSDSRIRAVLAIAPCTFPLTSEESLAAVTIPIMIMHGTRDRYCDYEGNALRTYAHLGTPDRYLVTVVNGFHQALATPRDARMHVMVAFFGYYLQGEERYSDYLTADFVESFDNLVWGVYQEE